MPSLRSRAHVTLIAEIGENYVGDPALAHRMMEQAAHAGADVVKFQSYLGMDLSAEDPEREWFSKVQLSDSLHRELKAHAEKLGIQFLSSPFTVDRARFLCEELGLRKIKVASSEMLNGTLLDYLNGQRLEEVYLSTGMATIEEVREALRHLDRVRSVSVLHCVTQYPAQDEEANLNSLIALAEAFPGRPIGYSDHTLGLDAPVAAVALGATVIEKHFTLDKALPGTDHLLSATPEEFAEMAQRIRRLEILLGDGLKRPTPREEEIRKFVRNRWRKEEPIRGELG